MCVGGWCLAYQISGEVAPRDARVSKHQPLTTGCMVRPRMILKWPLQPLLTHLLLLIMTTLSSLNHVAVHGAPAAVRLHALKLKSGVDSAATSALRAVTLDAAWQLFAEDRVGSIEVGKHADFCIVDRDPLEVDPDDLDRIAVRETWIGGRRA